MDRADSAVRDWLYRDVLGSPAGGGVLRIDDKEDQPPFRFTGKLDKLTIKLKPRKMSAEDQKGRATRPVRLPRSGPRCSLALLPLKAGGIRPKSYIH